MSRDNPRTRILHTADFLADDSQQVESRMGRREFLRWSAIGAGGLLLSSGMPLRALAAKAAQTPISANAKAKAIIQIWMWGGPCHIDTYDPKPEAGSDYCGPLNKPIETNVKEMRICQLLPELAKQADKFSVIRSMTHGSNAHETAAYMVQTGRNAGERSAFPSVGAVTSLFKGYDAGYKDAIPPYIVLTESPGRFSECGFLGNRYKPFVTGGNPAAQQFTVEGIVTPGMTERQQRDRRELLGKLNTLRKATKNDPATKAAVKAEEEAYGLILGDGAKLFDLSQEKDAVRDRYGRNKFGQSCLMARRLVERGVPFVTINYPGWDTHKLHFPTMNRQLPEMDKGLSALIADLADRGLLESTIVWQSGEFGRTPKVMQEEPWNGGRGHWGNVFSALVAGGGFKGGQVVGASDAKGEAVKDRPVYPCDLIGAFYELLGVPLDAKLPHPEGLAVRVLPTAEEAKTGGRLKEIL